jgi:hypothetical protein
MIGLDDYKYYSSPELFDLLNEFEPDEIPWHCDYNTTDMPYYGTHTGFYLLSA